VGVSGRVERRCARLDDRIWRSAPVIVASLVGHVEQP